MSDPSTSPLIVPLLGQSAWCLAGGQPRAPKVSVQVLLDIDPSLPPSIFPHFSLCSCLTVRFPKVLQCLNISVLSQKRCEDAYPRQIDDTMFCAGDKAGRDSCQVRTPLFIQQIHTECQLGNMERCQILRIQQLPRQSGPLFSQSSYPRVVVFSRNNAELLMSFPVF